MDEDIKKIFELAYTPVMYANQRLNGGDFISVAIPIMDALRKNYSDESTLRRAAKTMVLEFNKMLNPQMSSQQIDQTIEMVYNPGPLTRAMAKQIADEFVKNHG